MPEADQSGNFKVHPHKIFSRRIVPRNHSAVVQVLVQWINSREEEATWEDFDFMVRTFPEFDSYGDESSQGRGNVMNPPVKKKVKITIKPWKKSSEKESSEKTTISGNATNNGQQIDKSSTEERGPVRG